MHTETFGGTATTTNNDEPDTNTALAASPTAAIDGQLEASDLDIPRVNIAQKMSSEVPGTPGQISIGKEHVLYNPDVKVPMYILQAKKAWKTKTSFDSGERPEFASTLEEANRLKEEGHEVIHFAEFVLLIGHTADCLLTEDDVYNAFPYEIDGQNFALAKLTAQSFGYDTTFKRVATFAATNPALDLSNVRWNFRAVEKTSAKYKWHIPQFDLTRESAPEAVAAFIANLKGGAR